MAKALYGHLAATDPRLVWENDRLRSRVAALEAEVARLSEELALAARTGSAGAPDQHRLVDSLDAPEEDLLRPVLA